jgi:hypothetical protein
MMIKVKQCLVIEICFVLQWWRQKKMWEPLLYWTVIYYIPCLRSRSSDFLSWNSYFFLFPDISRKFVGISRLISGVTASLRKETFSSTGRIWPNQRFLDGFREYRSTLNKTIDYLESIQLYWNFVNANQSSKSNQNVEG